MFPEITKLLPWGIWRSNHIPNCFWKLGFYWPSTGMKCSRDKNTLTALFKFLFSTTCQNKLYLPPSTFLPTMNKMRVVTFQIMSEPHSMRVCPEIACNQSGDGRSVCTPLFRTISSACWRAHWDKHSSCSFRLFYQGSQMLYEDHHQLRGAERQVVVVTADTLRLLTNHSSRPTSKSV